MKRRGVVIALERIVTDGKRLVTNLFQLLWNKKKMRTSQIRPMKIINHSNQQKTQNELRQRATGWTQWRGGAGSRGDAEEAEQNEPGTSERSVSLPRSSDAGSGAETALFSTLGIVGIVAIILAVVSGSVPAGSKESPFAVLEKLPGVHYIHSGQLIADVRTAAAAVRYFFESDKPPGTNAIATGPIQKRLAMPTNNTSVVPKA